MKIYYVELKKRYANEVSDFTRFGVLGAAVPLLMELLSLLGWIQIEGRKTLTNTALPVAIVAVLFVLFRVFAIPVKDSLDVEVSSRLLPAAIAGLSSCTGAMLGINLTGDKPRQQ